MRRSRNGNLKNMRSTTNDPTLQDFHAAKPPASAEEDTANASRWPILWAWRWLARDTEKYESFSELYENEKMKAIDVEDEFDLAYRGIVPALLGRATQRIGKEEDDNYSED